MEVESEDASINLDIPGDGWISLDRKLAAALTKISEGEFCHHWTLATTAALNKNEQRGEEHCYVRCSSTIRLEKSAELMYEISHLHRIVLRGENLESFQNNWIMVLSELKKTPDPDVAQHLYFRQIQYFRPLAEDIAHCKRS